MGASQTNLKRIMCDIYGSRAGPIEQLGLADAIDEQDLDVKLDSLVGIWNGLVPGFHEWFKRNALACLIFIK